MTHTLMNGLRRMQARWERRRRAAETYLALRALDTQTLRDIGLHRSELLSIAAELSGDAQSTRSRGLA